MQSTSSPEQPITTTIDVRSSPQLNRFFFCRKDKTIPYLTFQIKDQDVNITMHCTDSSHTTTDVYQSPETKSKQKSIKTPKKKRTSHSKNTTILPDDQEWEHHSNHPHIPTSNKPKPEDHFVDVQYHCKQHPNHKLGLYCNTCRTNICSECNRSAHQPHHTFNVADLLENTNLPKWMKSMSQWEKGYYDDTMKKYKAAKRELNTVYRGNIKLNADLFDIVKSCFSVFELYKESYDINLYRNTANIANNFDFRFWKGWWNDNNLNGTMLNTGSTVDYLSTRIVLNVDNIPLPDSVTELTTGQTFSQMSKIDSTSAKQKYAPFKGVKCRKVSGKVRAVCKVDDSHFAVGCESPNDILIVDYNTFDIVHTLNLHTWSIWRLHVHKNSGYLLSLSFDNSLSIWDSSSGTWIKHLNDTGNVWGVAEWTNGNIITICSSGFIKYWSMTDYKCYRMIDNKLGLYDVILNDDIWLTGGVDGVKAFKEDGPSEYLFHNRWGYECDSKWVFCWWRVHGRWLCGRGDGWILIYDVTSFESIGELKGHSWYVYSLISLGNGSVASGAVDNCFKIWDWETKECRQTLELRSGINNGWCGWDENGVICGTYEDRAIRLFVRENVIGIE